MICNGLGRQRARLCSLPVARVGASPLLDAADLIGTAEDVAVAVLAKAAALAGGLAGATAIRRGAVALAVSGARVRDEEATATKAFAATRPTAHWEPEGRGEAEGRKPKKRPRKKTADEEGRRASGGRAGRKRYRRRRNFRPPQSPHFHSAPDRRTSSRESVAICNAMATWSTRISARGSPTVAVLPIIPTDRLSRVMGDPPWRGKAGHGRNSG